MSPKTIIEIVKERKIDHKEGKSGSHHQDSAAIGMIPYSLLAMKNTFAIVLNVKRFKILTIIRGKKLNLTLKAGSLKRFMVNFQ